jgi:hypothetical protein
VTDNDDADDTCLSHVSVRPQGFFDYVPPKSEKKKKKENNKAESHLCKDKPQKIQL